MTATFFLGLLTGVFVAAVTVAYVLYRITSIVSIERVEDE